MSGWFDVGRRTVVLDQLARFNQKRWDELAQSNVPYSRPMLDLDDDSARDFVDPEGILGDVRSKKVLCLAGGGGHQTAAFGLLGAEVAVLDLTLTQLDRDRQAAQHYGLQIQTCQGDMRDLSRFAADHFDIVHHAHSINFIPEPRVVLPRWPGLSRTVVIIAFLSIVPFRTASRILSGMAAIGWFSPTKMARFTTMTIDGRWKTTMGQLNGLKGLENFVTP